MKKPSSSSPSPGKETEEKKKEGKKEEKKEGKKDGKKDGKKAGDEDDNATSDRDVIKRLTDRLLTLQNKVDQQQMDLWAKDRYIKRLQDNLQILITARGGNTDPTEGDETHQRVKKLEHQSLLLQKQVHQMESFLADYGMVWVGETPDLDTDRDSLNLELFLEDIQDKETSAASFNIDFDLVLDNIQYLNSIAGDGETGLQLTTSGARLKRQAPVDVTFFANGLILAGGPFRPYSDPAAHQCLQDFLDGYFPTELQSRYPEGVPFSVTDKRGLVFYSDGAEAVFPGAGQMLGVSPEHAQLHPKEETGTADKDTQPAPPSPTPAQDTSPGPSRQVDVLANLSTPSAFGIIEEVQLGKEQSPTCDNGGQPAEEVVIETKACKSLPGENSEKKGPAPQSTCTLRVKSESGNLTYLLHMRSADTISDLRHYLDTHRKRYNLSCDYLICSAYPRQVYNDGEASLQACGLFPNGVLYLQARTNT